LGDIRKISRSALSGKAVPEKNQTRSKEGYEVGEPLFVREISLQVTTNHVQWPIDIS
jgi:hypothetical protein